MIFRKIRPILRLLSWSYWPLNGALIYRGGASGVMVIVLMALVFAGRIQAEQSGSIVGRWYFKDAVQEITGDIERGTSAYPYRWENNQGEVLYTDQNGFDPNRNEEYNTKEWKRSQVWDRNK
jgi:hypothetical protein